MLQTIYINSCKPYNIEIVKHIDEIFTKLPQDVEQWVIIYDIKLEDVVKLFIKNLNITNTIFCIEANEKNKSLSTVFKLCEDILQLGINKNTHIIALGGGIIGDIATFCASILLRGVSIIQVPTTLLAMVDSSIGGKNGVNTDTGKNMVGTIYSPLKVIICTEFLSTLPQEQFLCGYAEVVKYGLLFSEDFYEELFKNTPKLLSNEHVFMAYIIVKSCLYKKVIVENDEFETKGERLLLNLGHTFGHAFEKYNNYKINLTHGHAIAIGCILAMKFSKFLNVLEVDQIKEMEDNFKKVGLQTNINSIIRNIDINKLIGIMQKDKKNTATDLTFVLLKKIGECFVKTDITSQQLSEFLSLEIN